jgi:hypothetical protein
MEVTYPKSSRGSLEPYTFVVPGSDAEPITVEVP